LFYTPGVIGLAGAEIVIRTFYAMEDTRTPVLVGVVTIALNAALARAFLSLTRDIGLIAFAYSLTNMLEFVILLGLLGRRLNGFGATRLLRSILVLGPSSFALFLTLIASVWLSRGRIPGVTFDSPYGRSFDFLVLAGWLGAAGLLSFAVYLAVGALMRAQEVHEVWALLRRRREG
jgi:putative peptidoglycan lipid II flippase